MAVPVHDVENNPNPADYAIAVVPNDSTDLAKNTRALYVGASGDVSVDFPDGGTVVFYGVVGGTILPIRVKRVRATGTTAVNINAMF